MNYTLSIVHLGDRIMGSDGFAQQFPGGERTPTLAELQEIQRRLTALGFDTGGADGRVGNSTMLAVRKFPAQGRNATGRRLCRREASGAVASGALIRFYGAFAAPETEDNPCDDCNSQGGVGRREAPWERCSSVDSRPRAPGQSDRHQCAGIRQRRGRGYAARARYPLHRAQSRCELSRPARLDRQLPRQRDAADAVVPARGECRRHRPRLCQGHGQGDGCGGALQCGPVPRHHGDLQRLVRPHAGHRAGRHRPGRCRQAPSLDRLDSHRTRPGRDRARLHQMGRSARLPCRRPRGAHPRHLDGQYRADGTRSTSISTPRCRRRSLPSRCRRSMWRATCRRLRPRLHPSWWKRRRRCSRPPSSR